MKIVELHQHNGPFLQLLRIYVWAYEGRKSEREERVMFIVSLNDLEIIFQFVIPAQSALAKLSQIQFEVLLL